MRTDFRLLVSLFYRRRSLADCLLDLVFVVDNSGSISFNSPDNWDIMKDFLVEVVKGLGAIGSSGARVGMVQFGDDAINAFYLRDYGDQQSLIDAIRAADFRSRGTTNTERALNMMRTEQFTYANGDRPEAVNVALLLTDGKATSANHLREADQAKADGITIIAIGVTSSVDANELRLISSPPQIENQNYFLTTDFSRLDQIVQSLVLQTCSVASTLPPTTTAYLPITTTRIIQQTYDFYCRYEGIMGIMCYCLSGSRYIPVNSTLCEDINECDDNNGGCEDSCVNTEGSYFCECRNTGLLLSEDRHECLDINECRNSNACPSGYTCENTYGSYFCLPPAVAPTTRPVLCTDKADIIFSLDSSGSINEEKPNWPTVLQFISDVVSDPGLNVGRDTVRVGVVVYSNDATVEISLSDSGSGSYVQYLQSRIRSLQYVGSTSNIASGIEVARNEFRSFTPSGTRKILVLMTDGKANEREAETLPQAQDAKSENIDIITVGVTDRIDAAQLRQIASDPSQFISVNTFDELTMILKPLVESACKSGVEKAMKVVAPGGAEVMSVASAMTSKTVIAVATVVSVINLAIFMTLGVRCLRNLKQRRHRKSESTERLSTERSQAVGGTLRSFNSLSSKFGATAYANSDDSLSSVSSTAQY